MQLLVGVHHIPSSTSESVSILVNVDEQTNCDGVEGLTITANMIASTQQTNYSDTMVTFSSDSISAGDYTCSVTVEDETGPVESVHIPCAVSRGEQKHNSACLYEIRTPLGPAVLSFVERLH